MTTTTALDLHLVEECFQRIAGDLAMIVDRQIEVSGVAVERATERVAAGPGVHISFKLGLQHRGRILHGAFLVPLPSAITLAGHLMMLPDDRINARRSYTKLDPGLKDALMEVGIFVGGATDAALRSLDVAVSRVKSEGCQGVRAHVRPAFRHVDGDALIVARAQMEIHMWPRFETLLMLPVLPGAADPSTPS